MRSLGARSREPDMVTAKELLRGLHGRVVLNYTEHNLRLDSLGPKNGRAIYPYGGFPVEKSSFRSNFRFISISPDQTLASLASLALIRLRAYIERGSHCSQHAPVIHSRDGKHSTGIDHD